MRNRYILIIFVFVFFIAGCDTLRLQKDVNEAKATEAKIQNDLTERSRQLTTAVSDIIENKKSDGLNIDEEIIGILSREDQRIEGLPIERLDTDELVTQYIENKDEFLRGFEKFKTENTQLKRREQELEVKINSLTEALEIEKNRPWYSRVKSWFFGLGISGMILTIILCVVAPQFAVPLIGRFFGQIVKIFPSLIGMIGSVGKDIFDATLKGFQNIREDIKNLPDDAKLSKEEVMVLLNKMKEEHDKVPGADKIIRQRKAALKL
jgi:hypothetical protein